MCCVVCLMPFIFICVLLFLFISSSNSSNSQMYTFTEGGICDRERYCTEASNNKNKTKYNRSKCVRIILYVSRSIFLLPVSVVVFLFVVYLLFDINQIVVCSLVDCSCCCFSFRFSFFSSSLYICLW